VLVVLRPWSFVSMYVCACVRVLLCVCVCALSSLDAHICTSLFRINQGKLQI